MPNPKKLTDILPATLKEGESVKIDEYFDQELVIHDCRFLQGENGEFARMVVSLPEDTKQFFIATGASQPLEVLHFLKDNRSFPVFATFYQKGRAILVK